MDPAVAIDVLTTTSTQQIIYVKATIRAGMATEASIDKEMSFVICSNEVIDASQPTGT